MIPQFVDHRFIALRFEVSEETRQAAVYWRDEVQHHIVARHSHHQTDIHTLTGTFTAPVPQQTVLVSFHAICLLNWALISTKSSARLPRKSKIRSKSPGLLSHSGGKQRLTSFRTCVIGNSFHFVPIESKEKPPFQRNNGTLI